MPRVCIGTPHRPLPHGTFIDNLFAVGRGLIGTRPSAAFLRATLTR